MWGANKVMDVGWGEKQQDTAEQGEVVGEEEDEESSDERVGYTTRDAVAGTGDA